MRLSNVLDGVTTNDVPPVVAWEWAWSYLPYLGFGDSHFKQQDARTERRVREASGILVRASQVESSQVHTSPRRAYSVPKPSWWSAMEVPFGFPAGCRAQWPTLALRSAGKSLPRRRPSSRPSWCWR